MDILRSANFDKILWMAKQSKARLAQGFVIFSAKNNLIPINVYKAKMKKLISMHGAENFSKSSAFVIYSIF